MIMTGMPLNYCEWSTMMWNYLYPYTSQEATKHKELEALLPVCQKDEQTYNSRPVSPLDHRTFGPTFGNTIPLPHGYPND